MLESEKVHTVTGIAHRVDFRWVDSSGGYMKIQPPVEIGDSEFELVTDNGPQGIDNFHMLASSFGSDSQEGGTLFWMGRDGNKGKPEDSELIEYAQIAAEALLRLADGAATQQGFENL